MFILGRKLNMSQVWDSENKVVPITIVKCLANKVVGIKTKEKDGYEAVVISDKKASRELRIDKKLSSQEREAKERELKKGEEIKVSDFFAGDKVKVTGISKGKGFQGVVKRHNFSGGGKTHGHRHDLRQPGSIGSAFPQHVMKGKKMAGRMGQDRTSLKNLKIIRINEDEGTIMIEGAVPGKRNDLLIIRSI